jgi:hypothetical protein
MKVYGLGYLLELSFNFKLSTFNYGDEMRPKIEPEIDYSKALSKSSYMDARSIQLLIGATFAVVALWYFL